MAIDITRPHSLTQDQAKTRVEAMVKSLATQYNVDWHWDGDRIPFSASSGPASGVTGTITVNPNNVRVQADLPPLAVLFQGKIESQINAKLTQALAPSPVAKVSRNTTLPPPLPAICPTPPTPRQRKSDDEFPWKALGLGFVGVLGLGLLGIVLLKKETPSWPQSMSPGPIITPLPRLENVPRT